MHFSVYQESRRGARKSNQDRIAYCSSRDTLLLLVADGLGGHLHGEIAAQIAVQFITDAFRREAKPGLSDPRAFLLNALGGAHHAIIQNAKDDGLRETPSTTCVACVVTDNAAFWAHAGDSRLYHIRDGTVLAQTKDHSLVQQLIDRGRIREQAVAAHPLRNRIFSCLGSESPPLVDLSEATRLNPGDTLVLCSDGLWSPLSGNIISSAVFTSGIMQAVPDLLDQAEQRAGRECDNLSVIAVTLEEHPPATPPGPKPGAAETQDDYLSDDEIECAIARINSTIRQKDDKT